MTNRARLVAAVGAVYALAYGAFFAVQSWDAFSYRSHGQLIVLSFAPLCGLPLLLGACKVKASLMAALAVGLGAVQFLWWHAAFPGTYSGVMLLPVMFLAGLALLLFLRGEDKRERVLAG